LVQSFVLPSTDPWINLAREETLFRAFGDRGVIMVLYVNRGCVVMGKHQNPLREVRFEALRKHKVPVLRRFSGGGTVYHDEGNLNYSFLAPKEEFNKAMFLKFVEQTISHFGQPLTLTTAGDLLLGPAKVSGTASQIHRERSMVHGTLLCCADLVGLHGLLGPTGELEKFVGVASRPSLVANLDLGVADVVQALVAGFHQRWGGQPQEWASLSAGPIGEQTGTLEGVLRSRDWTWDRTPAFTWAGETLLGKLKVKVEDGLIQEALSHSPGDETQNLSRMVGKSFFSSEFFDLEEFL
jgi:lipoate-protein ligase A